MLNDNEIFQNFSVKAHHPPYTKRRHLTAACLQKLHERKLKKTLNRHHKSGTKEKKVLKSETENSFFKFPAYSVRAPAHRQRVQWAAMDCALTASGTSAGCVGQYTPPPSIHQTIHNNRHWMSLQCFRLFLDQAVTWQEHWVCLFQLNWNILIFLNLDNKKC